MKRGRGPGRTSGPAGRFPGEIAGASLKRSVWPRAQRHSRGFPGEIAGASLKRATGREVDVVRPLIPRRNRRGLIEAWA